MLKSWILSKVFSSGVGAVEGTEVEDIREWIDSCQRWTSSATVVVALKFVARRRE